MAFEGKIELSWENHFEDGYVTVIGEVEKDEGETRQASTNIDLEDLSEDDINIALYSIYKDICFDTLYNFMEGWISMDDPAYELISQIYFYEDNEETNKIDEKTRQIYFDETDIKMLEDILIEASTEYYNMQLDEDEDESED